MSGWWFVGERPCVMRRMVVVLGGEWRRRLPRRRWTAAAWRGGGLSVESGWWWRDWKRARVGFPILVVIVRAWVETRGRIELVHVGLLRPTNSLGLIVCLIISAHYLSPILG